MADYQQNQEVISTNGIALFCEEPVMIRLSFYNDLMSVDFLLGVVDQSSGKTSYPKDDDKRFHCSLTLERAAGLLHLLDNEFLPEVLNNKPCTTGITTNNSGTNVLDFHADEEGNVMVRYHVNVDSETRKPQKTCYFPFRKIMNIKDYNIETGNFELNKIHANLIIFRYALKSFVDSSSLAYVHGTKKEYNMKNHIRQLGDIAMKMGIQPSDTRNYQRSNNQSFGAFQQPKSAPQLQEVNDLSSLLTGQN